MGRLGSKLSDLLPCPSKYVYMHVCHVCMCVCMSVCGHVPFDSGLEIRKSVKFGNGNAIVLGTFRAQGGP